MKIKTEWTTAGLPKTMRLKLAKLVGHEGFTSVSDIVMYCIRAKMYEIDAWLEKIEKEDVLHEIKDKV